MVTEVAFSKLCGIILSLPDVNDILSLKMKSNVFDEGNRSN